LEFRRVLFRSVSPVTSHVRGMQSPLKVVFVRSTENRISAPLNASLINWGFCALSEINRAAKNNRMGETSKSNMPMMRRGVIEIVRWVENQSERLNRKDAKCAKGNTMDIKPDYSYGE